MARDNANQHWLPVGYLRQFRSATRPGKLRKDPVYMLRSSGIHKEVPCDTQGFDTDFYTAVRRDDERKFFEKWDEELPRIARLISDDQEPNIADLRTLTGAMILMHARNASIVNRSGEERLDMIATLERIMLGQIIAELPPDTNELTITEVARRLIGPRWRFYGVRVDRAAFATSDNPAVWFTAPNGSRFLGMPMSPTTWCIFYDAMRLDIEQPDAQDAIALNQAVAQNGATAVYSSFELPPAQRDVYITQLARGQLKETHVDKDGATLRFTASNHLNFMRPR